MFNNETKAHLQCNCCVQCPRKVDIALMLQSYTAGTQYKRVCRFALTYIFLFQIPSFTFQPSS